MTTSIPNNTSSSDTASGPGFFGRRPWLWVVAAFVVLLGAWTALFYIAMNNQPEVVPLKHLAP
ncbi:MAG: hypothetical protein HS117_26780 [Verrucomicrobiaceae bacterium]|jgi:hypothetical protein|nr:hypothetical protein [Verrucomicrobiaceae bacterium]